MRISLIIISGALLLLHLAAAFQNRKNGLVVAGAGRGYFLHDENNRNAKNPDPLVPIKNKRQRLYMSSAMENNDERGELSWVMLLGLPLASLIFPQLLQIAKSLPPNSSEQLVIVITLFVTNRVYLYALSGTIVGLAALRGAGDSPKLGERITDLTNELLFRPSLRIKSREDRITRDDDEGKPSIIRSLTDSGFQKSLDDVSSETQALFLPIVVSLLLALSVFLLPLWTGQNLFGGSFGEQQDSSFVFLSEFKDFLSQVLPKISTAWNICLLALFTRSELRRLGSETGLFSMVQLDTEGDYSYDSSSIVIFSEWAIAIAITSLAFFFQQWPAQNFVNMALAILVARVIQLNKFRDIIAALCLLTLYDATSVFLIPAANAIDPPSSAAAAGSAMGSVAIQKLSSSVFQPGLLTTKIGNSLGGSLGLGDAVFPSLLVNFCRRFDLHQEQRQKEEEDEEINRPRISLLTVSMGGYFLGCFACEFAPMISSSGIPALVFIVPVMLGSILLTCTVTSPGNLKELFEFDSIQYEE